MYMTDEELDNTLCKVVVTWQEINPITNTIIYKGISLSKTVKEAIEDIINSRLPCGKVYLSTTDEEPILIAVFPEHKRQFPIAFPG